MLPVEAEAPSELVERLSRLGVRLSVVAVVLQTVSHVGNAYLLDYRLGLATADGDTTAWSWASAVVTYTVAFVIALLLVVTRRGRLLHWLAVAALLFLSQDDTNAYHERLSTIYTAFSWLPDHSGRLVWPLLYAPLMAMVVWVLLTLARAAPRPAQRQVHIGIGLLGVAILLEMASTALVNAVDYEDWPYVLEVVLEEGAELAGWLLIATGFTAMLVSALQEPTLTQGPETPASPRSID